jgi:hypothetical protein
MPDWLWGTVFGLAFFGTFLMFGLILGGVL